MYNNRSKKKMIKYNKINMEKIDNANKLDFQQALENAIKMADKIIENLKSW